MALGFNRHCPAPYGKAGAGKRVPTPRRSDLDLDAQALSDGDVVLVSTRPAPTVPSNATLRRVIAAGGPPSLPPDFADQHDAHAHGAAKR